MGFLHGAFEVIRWCRKTGREFWFIDHAYWDRGYDRGHFRVVKNGIHKTHISGEGDTPPVQPWHGGDLVIIPPSEMIAITFDAQDWTEKALERAQGMGMRVRVKQKADGPLAPLLPDCGLMFSFASVAEVEAVIAGVMTYSVMGPAKPINGKTDRDRWLRSLAAGQFYLNQMRSGEAWRILNGD